MIFVTTGTQLSFERLVRAVDDWAKERRYNGEIFAQTGETKTTFCCIETRKFLGLADYNKIISKTSLLIGHAGIGTILTAHDYQLPLIIMPRQLKYSEHRNDHQMATVSKFRDTPGVHVAIDREELFELLDKKEQLERCGDYQPKNRKQLIDYLSKEFKVEN